MQELSVTWTGILPPCLVNWQVYTIPSLIISTKFLKDTNNSRLEKVWDTGLLIFRTNFSPRLRVCKTLGIDIVLVSVEGTWKCFEKDFGEKVPARIGKGHKLFEASMIYLTRNLT